MSLIRKYIEFKSLKLSYQDNESDQKVILVTHANGFSGSCYSYLYRYFGDKYRWIFLDFIGHSYSDPSQEFSDWNFFKDQIYEIIKKERDLRFIMKPMSNNDLFELINSIGFSIVAPFWQMYNFKGIIAIK